MQKECPHLDSNTFPDASELGLHRCAYICAFLAVAATDDRAVNHRIAADCAALGIPCSVADSAAESTFFFPAVCEGGGLTAGVVSDGTQHDKTARAAKRIRTVLEELE